MIGSRLAGAIAAAAAALVLCPAFAATPRYTITDLGPLTQANAIAAHGTTAGWAGSNAALWQRGRLIDLGTLGGDHSNALAVNASGQVAGYSTTLVGDYCAFIYDQGRMKDIGNLGADYAAAYGINDLGQVVGSSDLANGENHAFLWDAGKMTDLGTLGAHHVGWTTSATGINDAGQVVGYSYTDAGAFHGFLYENGRMRDLGSLGGDLSQAFAINASGLVTGQAYLPNGDAHAVVWRNRRIHDLGALNHYSSALAINTQGAMVGDADVVNNSGYLVYHAVIFEHGAPVDLNARIPKGSGWTLTSAQSIDDKGRIVGYGFLRGQQHGFVLTPR